MADRFRPKLIDLLGPEKGKAVKYAEAFEVCEYGSQPTRAPIDEDLPVLRPIEWSYPAPEVGENAKGWHQAGERYPGLGASPR